MISHRRATVSQRKTYNVLYNHNCNVSFSVYVLASCSSARCLSLLFCYCLVRLCSRCNTSSIPSAFGAEIRSPAHISKGRASSKSTGRRETSAVKYKTKRRFGFSTDSNKKKLILKKKNQKRWLFITDCRLIVLREFFDSFYYIYKKNWMHNVAIRKRKKISFVPSKERIWRVFFS